MQTRGHLEKLTDRIPFSWFRRLMPQPFLIPCYHIVADRSPAHIRPLFAARRLDDFYNDIRFFLRHCLPATAEDLLSWTDAPVKREKCGVTVTFDDGLREACEIAAPLLKREGVPAIFFVNSAFIDNKALFYRHKAALILEAMRNEADPERVQTFLADHHIRARTPAEGVLSIGYGNQEVLDELAEVIGVDFAGYLRRERPYMTSEQLRGLFRDGFSIGGHSVDHPHFAEVSPDEQIRQVLASVRFVRDCCGTDSGLFAFPFSADGAMPGLLERVEGEVRLFFGTGGCCADPGRRYFDRITMERPGSAHALAARALLSRIFQF